MHFSRRLVSPQALALSAALAAGLWAGARPAEATLVFSQTQSGAVPSATSPLVLTFTGTPVALGDATLSLIATGGELANNGKRLDQLKVDGDTYETPGWSPGMFLPVNYLDQFGDPVAPVTIPLANLSTYVADGQVEVSIVQPGFLAGGVFDVTLSYATVPEPSTLLVWASVFGALATRRR